MALNGLTGIDYEMHDIGDRMWILKRQNSKHVCHLRHVNTWNFHCYDVVESEQVCHVILATSRVLHNDVTMTVSWDLSMFDVYVFVNAVGAAFERQAIARRDQRRTIYYV